MRVLLAPESPEEASVWTDEYRHDHRGTGPTCPPLADAKIDMAASEDAYFLLAIAVTIAPSRLPSSDPMLPPQSFQTSTRSLSLSLVPLLPFLERDPSHHHQYHKHGHPNRHHDDVHEERLVEIPH